LNSLFRRKLNMKRVLDYIRDSMYKKKGLFLPNSHKPLAKLRKIQWNTLFEKMCRNRLLIGAYRYGELHTESSKSCVSVEDIKKRLDLYTETGNLEYLVDVANYAMLEFTYSKHKNVHFKANDDGIHSIGYNQKGE